MEKNKENYLIYVLIFCVVLAFGGGYLLGNSMTKNSNIVENKDSNEANKDNLLVDALGRELFKKYNVENDFKLYFYSDGKLNYKNFDYERKMELALINSNFEIIENDNSDIEDPMLATYTLKVSVDNFEKSYKNYFGVSNKITYNEFGGYISSVGKPFDNCSINDSYILCNAYDGGTVFGGKEFVRYDYSLLKDEKLEVFINYLYVDGEFGTCSDIKCENVIDSNNKNYDNINSNVNETELFNKYKDKAGTYKMVFEKDTDGNYYWVETDVVKK